MEITFKGSSLNTMGDVPKIGANAPEFTLVKTDLNPTTLDDYPNQYVLMNVFLSIDTSVCAESVIRFNQSAANHPNTSILCVSMDLPFSLQRFCTGKNLDNVIAVSAFRNPEFGKNYGLTIKNGSLEHLLARAVIIINPKKEIIYSELVQEITHEPNYEAALKKLPT